MGIFRSYQSLMDRWAHGRTVVVSLLASMVVYCYMVFISIPAVMVYEGNLRLFDMQPLGFDLEYARLLLHSLGTEGRHIYLTRQLPIDMVYPLLFAISGSLLLYYLFKKATPARPRLLLLSLIPMLAGLCDYMENFGIISMLRSFPDISRGTVAFTSACTIGKSGLTALFWLLMLVGLVMVLAGRSLAAKAE